ncbi:hypothetical protein HOT95_gp104 [Vibrio phage vB_VpS_PG07]|uniref:Uncharacterized protein n=3 Tax=Pogseptimavirus TaxID=2732037 RepID=A0A411BKI6_9CAUD|nr:hypothetical protein HOT95_gp104 [Vibrio phage vB_VpS_PG07]YP_009819540.1 hypothetical protein HOV08_gp022 [Vibrio phage VspSw_1]AXQ66729.1 hypothetical protein [Vibrio phage vB_VpS_PG07]QAY02096.1 hypothetical protein VspSw1_22 [Vibrio phage VspSw_1]QKN88414.1 hypothetical protein vBValSX1_21 [Vibrio phage vB_ValS_X1]
MRMTRFLELSQKFDTFYAQYKYKKAGTPNKSFIVATTNFDTPYLKAELEKAPEHVQKQVANPKDGYVALFCYTTNKFRTMPVDVFTHLSMLSYELDKQERDSRRFTRA